jgi:hypothetical protein
MRRGQKWKTKAGYVVVRLDDHPLFPGKTIEYEHRVKMAEHLGRRLRKGEIVHHKKSPRWNNRLSNLELKKNQKDHMAEHRQPCTPERAANISAAKRGRVSPAMFGHTFNRGRKRSKAFKAKVSAGMLKYKAANPVSAATRLKLSAAAKRRRS